MGLSNYPSIPLIQIFHCEILLFWLWAYYLVPVLPDMNPRNVPPSPYLCNLYLFFKAQQEVQFLLEVLIMCFITWWLSSMNSYCMGRSFPILWRFSLSFQCELLLGPQRHMKNAQHHQSLGMQIKPTLHLSEYVLLKKQQKTNVGQNVEKREPFCTVGRNVNCCTTMENSIEVTKNIKSRLIIWSSNSASGYFSQENKNTNSKRSMHFYVHCSIICNSKDMEQPKCPLIGEWIYIYTYIYIKYWSG